MKRLKEIASRASLLNLVAILRRNTQTLSDIIAAQNTKIDELESVPRANMHQLEKDHRENLNIEVARLSKLSDKAFQCDLEKKFGRTSWAKSLISKMISDRASEREWSHFPGSRN